MYGRPVEHRLGVCSTMDEAWEYGLELMAPVMAPGGTGEIASDMLRAEPAIGSGDCALDLGVRRIHSFGLPRAAPSVP